MTVSVEVDVKAVRTLFRRAPKRLAKAFGAGARNGVSRFRGFHRKRRMSRKKGDRVGIYATNPTKDPKGLKGNKFFPVKKFGGDDLGSVGAEITVRNIIARQLEHGWHHRPRKGSQMTVPFSKYQKRGKPNDKTIELRKQRKLILIRRANGDAYLVERRSSRSKKLFFRYHLQNQIKVPARLEFEKLFAKREYRAAVIKEMNRQFTLAIDRLNKTGTVPRRSR